MAKRASPTRCRPSSRRARATRDARSRSTSSRSGYDLIKIYNNVSRDGYLGLAEEARRLGLPFAGHEPGSLSAIELSNAGQKSIEHSRIFLFNCFPGADSLQKGLLRAGTAVRQRMVDEYDPRVVQRSVPDVRAESHLHHAHARHAPDGRVRPRLGVPERRRA